MVNLSGVTDCYQPVERKLRLTRRRRAADLPQLAQSTVTG